MGLTAYPMILQAGTAPSPKSYVQGALLPAPVDCLSTTPREAAMPAKSTTIRRIEAPGWGNPTKPPVRSALHQHHPHPRDGRRAAGQFRPSGHADGTGAGGLHHLAEFSALRSGDPIWPNRDRFVLSNGHASMLLYAILASSGVKAVNAKYERLGEPAVSLDDIKRFRQLGSKCPGHPEYHLTSGVETTTGPLGQGCGNSVGMAMAGRWLAQHFNRPDFAMFDYNVYVICGDGDMMEGVSSEAASLAGHQMLGNLCWIYDNNRMTIEGHTELAFSEDVAARFLAYGWNVQRVGDVNDLRELGAGDRDFPPDQRTRRR